jgi:hypothetical protein
MRTGIARSRATHRRSRLTAAVLIVATASVGTVVVTTGVAEAATVRVTNCAGSGTG